MLKFWSEGEKVVAGLIGGMSKRNKGYKKLARVWVFCVCVFVWVENETQQDTKVASVHRLQFKHNARHNERATQKETLERTRKLSLRLIIFIIQPSSGRLLRAFNTQTVCVCVLSVFNLNRMCFQVKKEFFFLQKPLLLKRRTRKKNEPTLASRRPNQFQLKEILKTHTLKWQLLALLSSCLSFGAIWTHKLSFL